MTPQKSIPAAYSDEWLAWMYKEGTVGHHHAMRLRDELAAAKGRIAELEAAAAEWVPIDKDTITIAVNGQVIGKYQFELPGDVYLCRRQPQEGAQG